MRISTLLLCLLTATAHAQTNRDSSISPTPTDSQSDADAWAAHASDAKTECQLLLDSADEWIGELHAARSIDPDDGELSMAEEWQEYTDMGYQIPDWCISQFTESTIVNPVRHELALGLINLDPTYLQHDVGDLEHQFGDLVLAVGYFRNAVQGLHNENVDVLGYVQAATDIDAVENAAAIDAECMESMRYYVAMDFEFWFYYGI